MVKTNVASVQVINLEIHLTSVAFTTSTIASELTQDFPMCQKFSDLTEVVVVVVVLLIVIILRKYSGKNLTHNLLPHTMVLL